MKYIKLTDSQFNAAVALYTDRKAGDSIELFYQFAIESCLRYIEHGEVSHLNNLVIGSQIMKQVYPVRKMTSLVAVHTKLNSGKFKVGKADAKKLSKLRKNVTDITRKLEAIVKAQAEIKIAKGKAKPEYDTAAQLKSVKNVVSKLIKADLTDDQIIAMVRLQLEELSTVAKPAAEPEH